MSNNFLLSPPFFQYNSLFLASGEVSNSSEDKSFSGCLCIDCGSYLKL